MSNSFFELELLSGSLERLFVLDFHGGNDSVVLVFELFVGGVDVVDFLLEFKS